MLHNSPYISGFTFIKNGLTLGYPIKESIESIAPLCDEIIINIGVNDLKTCQDDGTYSYLKDSFPQKKFKFFTSVWDPTLTKNGLILSQQTNLALERCQGKFCQYIQGDECLHENDLSLIENDIKKLEKRSDLHALIFNYIHFYGNVDIYKKTRNAYRREIRLIKNNLNIKSYLDAQGFRYQNEEKIKGLLTNAKIYHYGWARKESVMKNKVKKMNHFYHGKEAESFPDFQYQRIWGLYPFQETHPSVMQEWIKKHKNDLDILSLPFKWERNTLSLMVSDFIEKITGFRIGEFKNYIL